MSKKLIILLLLTFKFSFSQEYKLLWEENFNNYQIPSGIEGENDGSLTTNQWLYMGDYNSSFTKWTLDASNASLQNFSDYAAVMRTNSYLDPHLRVQDTHGSEIKTPAGGHVNWITENINVANYTNISVSMFIQEEGDHETSDYIDVYYSTDNGANYTRIENWNNLGNTDHTLVGDTVTSSDCTTDIDFRAQTLQFSIPDSANSLKIKVTFKNGASSENFILDDVKVFGKTTTLGLTDNTLETFTMHPNPTQDKVSLKVSNTIKTIRIYNINGQLVYDKNSVNKKDHSLNMSGLSKGIYLVKIITTDNKQSIKKLIFN